MLHWRTVDCSRECRCRSRNLAQIFRSCLLTTRLPVAELAVHTISSFAIAHVYRWTSEFCLQWCELRNDIVCSDGNAWAICRSLLTPAQGQIFTSSHACLLQAFTRVLIARFSNLPPCLWQFWCSISSRVSSPGRLLAKCLAGTSGVLRCV